jgi:hypothetical protein
MDASAYMGAAALKAASASRRPSLAFSLGLGNTRLPRPPPLQRPQLKERYSKAKPYNEWVKAAVSMEDIFATVPPEQRERRLLALGAESTANGNGNGHVGALPTNGNGNGKVIGTGCFLGPQQLGAAVVCDGLVLGHQFPVNTSSLP